MAFAARLLRRPVAAVSKWQRIKADFLSGIVYHGTTLEIASIVMREGFRGLEFDEITHDVFARYGVTLNDLQPSMQRILGQIEHSYEHEQHLISTSPAGEVAVRFAGQGGEVAAQIEACVQGVFSTRSVQNSRISGEPVVVQAQIKDFDNTPHAKRARQMVDGMSRWVTNDSHSEDDAADELWSAYINFLCLPEQLEPKLLIRSTDLERLKHGPLR